MTCCSKDIPGDPAYLALTEDILRHPVFAEMGRYRQHGTTSCLEHCVNVSYLSYRYCLRRGLDARSAARGGLLHDLFLYDWHTYRPRRGEKLHGFQHPVTALRNAEASFDLSDRERDIILRHMWPLTPTPPRYREGFVVAWFDKYCTLLETLRRPVARPAALEI